MTKMFINNPYGYKVCYRKRFKRKVKYRFLTHTYKMAKDIKAMYLRYPPPDNNNKVILNVIWVIYPITKKEVKKGIWRKCPF